MEAIVRRAHIDDSAHIIVAHVRSIRELCAKDYTSEQIRAWAGRDFSTERWTKRIITEWVWVVEKNAFVEGVATFRSTSEDSIYIDALYLTSAVASQGYGRKILEAMENEARRLGYRHVQLQSTLTSLNFYKKMGYSVIDGGKSSVTMKGVELAAIEMQKDLNGSGPGLGLGRTEVSPHAH